MLFSSFPHGHISHESLDELAGIPTLRRVGISFSSSHEELIGTVDAPAYNFSDLWAQHYAFFGTPQPHVGALRNLTSLALLELFGDLPPWQEAIANVLSKSPQLASLALSLNEPSYDRTISHAEGYRQLYEFTDGICTTYSAKTTERLRLTMLHLGDYIVCPSLECLGRVTDLSVLEQLDIHNE